MSEERLIARAQKRGWDPHKIEAKIRRRRRVKEVARNMTSPLLRPVLEIVADAVPGGTIALGVLGAVVDGATGDRNIPVVADIAVVGKEMWNEQIEVAGGTLEAIGRDLIPLRQAVENGEWGKVVAGLALIGAGIAAFFILG